MASILTVLPMASVRARLALLCGTFSKLLSTGCAFVLERPCISARGFDGRIFITGHVHCVHSQVYTWIRAVHRIDYEASGADDLNLVDKTANNVSKVNCELVDDCCCVIEFRRHVRVLIWKAGLVLAFESHLGVQQLFESPGQLLEGLDAAGLAVKEPILEAKASSVLGHLLLNQGLHLRDVSKQEPVTTMTNVGGRSSRGIPAYYNPFRGLPGRLLRCTPSGFGVWQQLCILHEEPKSSRKCATYDIMAEPAQTQKVFPPRSWPVKQALSISFGVAFAKLSRQTMSTMDQNAQ